MRSLFFLFFLLSNFAYSAELQIDDVIVGADGTFYLLSRPASQRQGGKGELAEVVLSHFDRDGNSDLGFGDGNGHLVLRRLLPPYYDVSRQFLAQDPRTGEIVIAGGAILKPEGFNIAEVSRRLGPGESGDNGAAEQFSKIWDLFRRRQTDEGNYLGYVTKVSPEGKTLHHFPTVHFRSQKEAFQISGVNVASDGRIMVLRPQLDSVHVHEFGQNGEVLTGVPGKPPLMQFHRRDDFSLAPQAVGEADGNIFVTAQTYLPDLTIGSRDEFSMAALFGVDGEFNRVSDNTADQTLQKLGDEIPSNLGRIGLQRTLLVKNPKSGKFSLMLLVINGREKYTLRMLDPNGGGIQRPFAFRVVPEVASFFITSAGGNASGGVLVNTNASGSTILMGRDPNEPSKMTAVVFDYSGESRQVFFRNVALGTEDKIHPNCSLEISEKGL